jgi:hypothetical protein
VRCSSVRVGTDKERLETLENDVKLTGTHVAFYNLITTSSSPSASDCFLCCQHILDTRARARTHTNIFGASWCSGNTPEVTSGKVCFQIRKGSSAIVIDGLRGLPHNLQVNIGILAQFSRYKSLEILSNSPVTQLCIWHYVVWVRDSFAEYTTKPLTVPNNQEYLEHVGVHEKILLKLILKD